jgi:hypothetical protein
MMSPSSSGGRAAEDNLGGMVADEGALRPRLVARRIRESSGPMA